MAKAIYVFDSDAKLVKKGSIVYDEETEKYTFSTTEAYITQGSIGVDEICIVIPDTFLDKTLYGVFASFISPVRNPLGLIPGSWESRVIIEDEVETTYVNCAIFSLDLAYYTYVAGRYAFAIGFMSATLGTIKKTPYDAYIVQNGVDNFTENNLTPSDYDNLLTAITNLTSGFGGRISVLEDTTQDAAQRFDDTYLGVTIQTDIFPATGAEETVMGKIEVARDINPATVS
ncbi:MAG: hypothetical protein M0R51_08095, partial [Clostridia bacterium]|nr:hypothetical protein [Clostridia bacterium]